MEHIQQIESETEWSEVMNRIIKANQHKMHVLHKFSRLSPVGSMQLELVASDGNRAVHIATLEAIYTDGALSYYLDVTRSAYHHTALVAKYTNNTVSSIMTMAEVADHFPNTKNSTNKQ
jgi:hypothetical protein